MVIAVKIASFERSLKIKFYYDYIGIASYSLTFIYVLKDKEASSTYLKVFDKNEIMYS